MIRFLAFLIFLAVSASSASRADDIRNAFPILAQYQVEIGDVIEIDSIFMGKGTVKTPQGVKSVDFFVTKDMKTLIFGQGFDNESKRLFIPVDMQKYEKDAAFKMGTGKEKYYIFTDPECPYCHKMKLALKNMGDKATFYFYLYPLSFHKNAMDMSLWVLAEEENKKGWGAALSIAEGRTDWIEGIRSVPTKKAEGYREKIRRNMAIGDQLGVGGTPTVFDAQGNQTNWTDLVGRGGK